jgi:glutathione synthase/RimK-type ligase-like ATP-grasp enzyme
MRKNEVGNFLIYKSSTIETGGWLAEHLMKVKSIRMDHGTELPSLINVLIRWGSSKTFTGKAHRVLNKKKAIELARDKYNSLIVLKKAGIEVPKISQNPSDLKFPFLARKSHHQEAKDLFLCLQSRDTIQAKKSGADYYIQYVPTKKEFRIHIINDKIVKVFEKIPSYDDKMITFVRNNAFASFKTTDFDEANKIALKAVKILGLDFGAVDIILGDDNKLYVLEVNTAPRLNSNTLEIYVEEFTKLLKE